MAHSGKPALNINPTPEAVPLTTLALSDDDATLAEAVAGVLSSAPAQALHEALAMYSRRVLKPGTPLAIAAARKGMTLADLARACDVDPSMASHVARGTCPPSPRLAARIAYALEITTEEVADLLPVKEQS